jgi:hypothetical protein
LEEGLLGAAMVEDVVLGAAPATVVVDGDVVVVFTAVVEVVGWAVVDDVVARAVVVVVCRAKRLRAAAAAGRDVPRVATPTATATAEQTTALRTTSERRERTTCNWVSSSMSQLIDNDQRNH